MVIFVATGPTTGVQRSRNSMDLGFSIKFNFQNRQYYVRNRNILVLYTFSPYIPSVSYTFASYTFASYTFNRNTYDLAPQYFTPSSYAGSSPRIIVT